MRHISIHNLVNHLLRLHKKCHVVAREHFVEEIGVYSDYQVVLLVLLDALPNRDEFLLHDVQVCLLSHVLGNYVGSE